MTHVLTALIFFLLGRYFAKLNDLRLLLLALYSKLDSFSSSRIPSPPKQLSGEFKGVPKRPSAAELEKRQSNIKEVEAAMEELIEESLKV